MVNPFLPSLMWGFFSLVGAGESVVPVGRDPSLQEAIPSAQWSVRPDVVRVGDPLLVTLRIRTPGGEPEELEILFPRTIEVIGIRESAARSRTSAGEPILEWRRTYRVRALEAGTVEIPPARAYVGDREVVSRAVAIEVLAAPARALPPPPAPEREEEEPYILPEGTPPPASEETEEALPGTPLLPDTDYLDPYRSGLYGPFRGAFGTPRPFDVPPVLLPYGAGPYAPVNPPARGRWAERARDDPFWPSIVPELLRYDTHVDHPGEGISLSAGLTPRPVYVGQQLTYVATVFLGRESLFGFSADPYYLPPSVPDAWSVPLHDATDPLPAARGGGTERGTTFRHALFFLEAGRRLLPPPRVVLSRGDPIGSFAADTLHGEALDVEVLPIPLERAIPGFGGAVGRYHLSAHLEPDTVALGESARLTVEVEGVGYLPALPRPSLPRLPEAGFRYTGEWESVEVVDGVVGGIKTFTWLLVPELAGPLRLPPMTYPYFDPYVGDFTRAIGPELDLYVTELPSSGSEPGRRSTPSPGPARPDSPGGKGETDTPENRRPGTAPARSAREEGESDLGARAAPYAAPGGWRWTPARPTMDSRASDRPQLGRPGGEGYRRGPGEPGSKITWPLGLGVTLATGGFLLGLLGVRPSVPTPFHPRLPLLLAGAGGILVALGAGGEKKSAAEGTLLRDAPLRTVPSLDKSGRTQLVPSGTRVRIHDGWGAWLEVEGPEGERGWVAAPWVDARESAAGSTGRRPHGSDEEDSVTADRAASGGGGSRRS